MNVSPKACLDSKAFFNKGQGYTYIWARFGHIYDSADQLSSIGGVSHILHPYLYPNIEASITCIKFVRYIGLGLAFLN